MRKKDTDFQANYLKHASKDEVKELIEKMQINNESNGYTPSKEMRKIASVPYKLYAMMEKLDPTFWKDIKKVKAFLEKNPVFKQVKDI